MYNKRWQLSLNATANGIQVVITLMTIRKHVDNFGINSRDPRKFDTILYHSVPCFNGQVYSNMKTPQILTQRWNYVGKHIEYDEWYHLNSVLLENKGNNKITELRTIFQRESQNS